MTTGGLIALFVTMLVLSATPGPSDVRVGRRMDRAAGAVLVITGRVLILRAA